MNEVFEKFLVDVGNLDSAFDCFSTHRGVESVLGEIFKHLRLD